MKIDFVQKGQWVLPVSGTLGNKAKNLLENTVVIESRGLRVPKSLVIPHEYVNELESKLTNFLLELADRHFPGWKRLPVRSNAPDEDLNERTPGLYTSENLWHKDRAYAGYILGKVLDSYHSRDAQAYRFRMKLPERGMGLLIQELISQNGINFDAKFAGSYSSFGDIGVLTLVNPSNGMDAMNQPPARLQVKI